MAAAFHFTAKMPPVAALLPALGALWLAVGPVSAAEGEWHGAYVADLGRGAMEVRIELDQLPGGSSGMGDVSLYQLRDDCPTDAMSETFCRALHAAFARAIREEVPGNMVTPVEGVIYEAGSALVAFSLYGDSVLRVVEIHETPSGLTSTFHHPEYGIEAEFPVERTPHTCTFVMCSADRLEPLATDPDGHAGPLGALAFLRAYPLLSLNREAEGGDEESWEEEMFDLPGIGVYGPSYRLRNVPAGQRLAVRAAPQRGAATVGSLSRDAADILVLDCTPEIDSLAFEEADAAGKLRLLERAWCQVSHGVDATLIEGWVVGGYLDPVLEAKGDFQ